MPEKKVFEFEIRKIKHCCRQGYGFHIELSNITIYSETYKSKKTRDSVLKEMAKAINSAINEKE